MIMIGKKIKQLRRERQLTQYQLAEALQLPRYILGNIEQGRTDPSLDCLIKIANYFQCSTDELLSRDIVATNESPASTKRVFKLRELRESKHLSMLQLAQAIGVSDAAICNWENGVNEPKASYLIKLADFFNIPIDALFSCSQHSRCDTISLTENNGLKLKEFRICFGLKQEDLAKVIGVQAYTIGNWERERSEPSIQHLIKLADFFGCSVDELVGRKDLETGHLINKTPLTALEEDLIIRLRNLPVEDQYKTLGFLQALTL